MNFTDFFLEIGKKIEFSFVKSTDVASGISVDWAFTRRPDKLLSYTIELRDNGTYGFILPPDQIIPTAEETLDGLVAMYSAAAQLGYLNF